MVMRFAWLLKYLLNLIVMLRKSVITFVVVLFSQICIAQVNKLVTDGKKVTAVTESASPNGIATYAKVPETLTIVFPADFYNYSAVFSDGVDTTKNLVLTYSATAKVSKTLQKIEVQSASVDLVFLNGKLWAIGSHKLDTAVAVPVTAKGQFTVKILSTVKAAAKPKPKTLCDELDEATQKLQKILNVTIDTTDRTFRACFAPSYASAKANEVPFRYDLRLLLDKGYPQWATTASYLVIYDVRKKPQFSPFTFLKIKRDKGRNEHFVPMKLPFHPKSGASLVIQVIGEKDSTYVLKTDSTIRFVADEAAFAAQMTAQAAAAAKAAPADTSKTTKNAGLGEHNTEPQKLKANLMLLETGLSEFNQVFADINFRENTYYEALGCLKNAIVKKFGVSAADAATLADGLMQKAVIAEVPKENYQDICAHIQNVKQLYDAALNKKVTYSSLLAEMSVPDVDFFKIHIQSKNLKTDLTDKEYQVQAGLKIDFSTGLFYTSLGNSTFVTGNQNFQYRDAVQTVDPATGDIKTTYNPTLLTATRKVILKNPSRSFGTGVLAHVYVRTGAFYDFGLATGVFLNSSQVQGLIGPSIMLGNKTKRFCLSGGLAVGQEQVLSAENQQYFYDGKSRIYNNAAEVPQAYTSDSSPATVSHMNYHNWFVALTYNLSSTKTIK